MNYSELVWIDVNTNFGEDADPELVKDVAAINNSLFNLLNCPVGSRPFQRDYGSDLMQALFEPTDRQTVDYIDIRLFQSIKQWEPRVQLDRQSSYIRATDDGAGYDVSISYTIVRTQIRATYSFSVRRPL
jgi:phage baseplate assembly protein W